MFVLPLCVLGLLVKLAAVDQALRIDAARTQAAADVVAKYKRGMACGQITEQALKTRLGSLGVAASEVDRCATRDELLRLLLSAVLVFLPVWSTGWAVVVAVISVEVVVIVVCML